jgi:hypothetical protein
VDQAIARAGYLAPWHAGRALSGFERDVLGSLTQDLDQPRERERERGVGVEVSSATAVDELSRAASPPACDEADPDL